MSSSLKHVVKRRVHLERHQPQARQRLGILEKHKDYVLRAKAFHKKEAHIKLLAEKARTKNPDEFYYKMVKAAKLKDGGIRLGGKETTPEELKLVDTQDANYIRLKRQEDEKKIAALQASLHLIDAPRSNKHVLFVDADDVSKLTRAKRKAEEEASSSSSPAPKKVKRNALPTNEDDLALLLGTRKELLGRKANRLTTDQLKTQKIAAPTAAALKEQVEQYKELLQRQERSKKLKSVDQQIQLRKDLKTGGTRKLVASTDRKHEIYKWKPERKR